MKRHRTDLVALLFGVAFCAAGVAFLSDYSAGTRVDPAWIVAGAFVAVGLIALAGTLFRPARREHEAEDL